MNKHSGGFTVGLGYYSPLPPLVTAHACPYSEILALLTVGLASPDNSYQISPAGHHCSPAISLREFKCVSLRDFSCDLIKRS